MKPLIGIVAYSQIYEKYGWDYDVSYSKNTIGVERAGGLPVLIPSRLSDESLREIFDRMDGILFPGGGDIYPQHYNAEMSEKTNWLDPDRDRAELTLARWSVEADKPIFGICRGIQVVNVALGGTLYQDVPTECESDIKHNHPLTSPRSGLAHQVQVAEESKLAEILGEPVVTVNSLHHQGIKDLAPSLQVVATAPDGLIEAVEIPEKHFVLAVQWHPEDLLEDDKMQRLFDAFVTAVRNKVAV